MFTATSQRGAPASPRAKRSIRACACGSSLTTTTGFSPAIVRSSAAVARACARSSHSTSPAASGITARALSSSASASRSICGSSGVDGSIAVRSRRASSVGSSSSANAAIVSCASTRQRSVASSSRNASGRQTPSLDRVAVAVDEVRRAAAVLVVAHERDRAGVGPKRRARQREPMPRAVERRPQRGAPGRRLAGVVDLVEHHERRPREMVREQVRRRGDLLVRDHDAVDVLAPGAVRVAPARVQVQPDQVRGVRPLRAQRRRRAHDDDLGGARRADRLAGGERLARPRGRHEQEVGPRVRGVAREELRLPRSRRDHAGRAPFARLQRGHSACPFAGSVSPPALTGRTWSACQPGRNGSPHTAQRPRAARKSATRAAGRKRRTATPGVLHRRHSEPAGRATSMAWRDRSPRQASRSQAARTTRTAVCASAARARRASAVNSGAPSSAIASASAM